MFSHKDSFLGTKIQFTEEKQSSPHSKTASQRDRDTNSVREITLYNFYSPGRPTAIANLLSSGKLIPDESCIIMGDLNAYDMWWYRVVGSI